MVLTADPSQNTLRNSLDEQEHSIAFHEGPDLGDYLGVLYRSWLLCRSLRSPGVNRASWRWWRWKFFSGFNRRWRYLASRLRSRLRLTSLRGRDLVDSGRAMLGPSMVLPAAIGALGSGHLLGFQLGDALLCWVTLAADSADVDF